MSDNDDRHRLFEHCQLRSRRAVNPIIDWTDAEVWDYIADQHIPCNPAYCKYNLKRCGCVGCPMAGTQGRLREFSYWTGFKKLYIQAFDRMLIERKKRDLELQERCIVDLEFKKKYEEKKAKSPVYHWHTGMDVFHWWMEDKVMPGQIDILEEYSDDTTLL